MYYSHEIFFVIFSTLCKDLLFYYFIQFSTALEIGIYYIDFTMYLPCLLYLAIGCEYLDILLLEICSHSLRWPETHAGCRCLLCLMQFENFEGLLEEITSN